MVKNSFFEILYQSRTSICGYNSPLCLRCTSPNHQFNFFEAFFIFQKNVERKRLVSKIEFTLSRNIAKTTTCHKPFFTLTLSRLEDKRNHAINAVLS